MKTNALTYIRTTSGDISTPTYRPPGCFFVVVENEVQKFNVTDPTKGYNIATCNQFQTAVKFANLMHDILTRSNQLAAYANAPTPEDKALILIQSGLKAYFHLRLCKPGQFEHAKTQVHATPSASQ